MNPAVVHKHNMSFYIPQYKRWRGETYFFLNCQVTYPVWGFFSSACKKKHCFNRKNLNPFNPCKTDNLALEFLQVYLSSLDHLWIIMTAVSNIRNHFN